MEPCSNCNEVVYFLSDSCSNCNKNYDWKLEADCPQCDNKIDYFNNDVCDNCNYNIKIWRGIELVYNKSDTPLIISKDAVPNPVSQGYCLHLGYPKFQIADYRRINDDADYHVVSKKDRYELHIDKISAIQNPILHFVTYGTTNSIQNIQDIGSCICL